MDFVTSFNVFEVVDEVNIHLSYSFSSELYCILMMCPGLLIKSRTGSFCYYPLILIFVSFVTVGNRYVVLQVSRSIGDVYLKKAEFNREPLYQKFRLREPFKRPILSADPAITVHQLLPQDQFIIFASDGLWEHLTNQEAVDIVQTHPRSVSYLML